MTWQFTLLVLLTLLAEAWSHQAAGAAAPAHRLHTCRLALVVGGASPSSCPGQKGPRALRQANLLTDCGLHVKLCQLGGKTWLTQASCLLLGRFLRWTSNSEAVLTTPSRLRLHVLLCTWLI